MAVIDSILKKVAKDYGEGVLVKGSALKSRSKARASTGSLSMDLALGGGWPLNVWIEIVGNESSGKTATVLKTIAHQMAINPNYEVLWVASEDFVEDWAEQLGVDLDRLYVLFTRSSEDAFQVILQAQEERAVDAIVLDSLPALSPNTEQDKDMDEMTVGTAAKINNLFFRKTGYAANRSLVKEDRDCLLIMINQWRDQITSYGDPRTTPGGKGKNYSFFIRAEISRSEWIEGPSKSKVGQRIKMRVFKNKTAAPGKVSEVDFYFSAHGGFMPGDYDTMKEIFNIATAYEVVEQGGGYYKFQGERLADERGKEHAEARVKWDIDLQQAIKAEVHRVVLHKDPEESS